MPRLHQENLPAAVSLFLGISLLTSVFLLPGSVPAVKHLGHQSGGLVQPHAEPGISTANYMTRGQGSSTAPAPYRASVEGPSSVAPLAAEEYDWTAANISLGPAGANPMDTLCVNQTDEVYTTVYPSYVVVTSASSGETVARLDLGQDVSTLAYDDVTHEVLVASSSTKELFAIDVFSHRVAETIHLSGSAAAMSYDAANGELLVMVEQITNTGNETYTMDGTILVLDGTISSYPPLTSIPNAVRVGWFSGGFSGFMTVDTDQQVVYVSGAEGFSGYEGVQWLQLASPAVNGTLEAVGGGALTFDPATDEAYVVGGPTGGPSYLPNQISVISGVSHNVTAVITVGPAATTSIDVMTDDPSAGAVYAAASNGELYAIATLNNSAVAHYPITTECGRGISVDKRTGDIYIADSCGDELQVVSPAGGSLSQIVVGGGGPSGIAYDPHTRDVVVANALANNVSVVSTESQRVVARVDGIPEATAVVYDPQTSEVYVVGLGGTVVILSDQNWSVIDELALPSANLSQGEGFVAAAYDPLTEQVYVSTYDATGNSPIYLISGSTHEVTKTITVDSLNLGPADTIGFDSVSGTMCLGFVDGDVGWVNSTNSNLTGVRYVGDSVLSLAYDGDTGTMYAGAEILPESGAHEGVVIGLNGSTGATTSSTRAGDYPSALGWSAGTHQIVSANFLDSNVSIVSDATGYVVENLPVGLGPDAVAYDNLTGSMYVANDWSNTLSLLSPLGLYTVTFAETGLPMGTEWSVVLNGSARNSSTATITFLEVNGTYPFNVNPGSGYVASPGSGSIAVNGTFLSESIRITSLAVSPGLSWWVDVALGGVSAAAAVAVVLGMMRRPRPPVRAAPPSPPSSHP